MPKTAERKRTNILFAEERRKEILRLLQQDSHVLANELSNRFSVSDTTIRNDLRDLERLGLLRRTHGGAVCCESSIGELPREVAAHSNDLEKKAIGSKAAELVRDGDTIFCDSGSTIVHFVRALEGRKALTIVTNDIDVANAADKAVTRGNIVLAGGSLRHGFNYTTGSLAIQTIRQFTARYAFLAATACSFEFGLTVPTAETAFIKKAYMEHSDRHVLLMDASKFGHYATARYASIADIDVLITDDRLSAKNREQITTAPRAPKLLVV